MNEFQQQILQKIEQIALKLENYKSNNQDLTKLKEELEAKIIYLEKRERELNSQLENRNIPNFLIENSFSASDDDLSKGLKLVGDFLEKSILRPNNLIQPSSRLHFINTLK